jgi:hypothetical protein
VPEVLTAVDGREVSPEIKMGLGVSFEPGMPKFMASHFLPTGETEHGILGASDCTWLAHCSHNQMIGCYLSHLSVLWDCYPKQANRVLVLEDDIEVVRDPHLIEHAIDDLERIVGRNGWDVLYTNLDYKTDRGSPVPAVGYALRPNLLVENDVFHRRDIGGGFVQYGARCGTHSYVISQEGIKKVQSVAQIFGM